VAFLKEALVFLLGLEEAFTTVLFFAVPDLLEEEAGFDFIATVFFFKAFFLNVLDDALRTDFFLAMQSPFYKIVQKYNQVKTRVSLKKK